MGSVPFDITIEAGWATGSSSLTVLLTKSNSGRNAYQAVTRAMPPKPIMRLRLFIDNPPLSLFGVMTGKILLVRCRAEVKGCRVASEVYRGSIGPQFKKLSPNLGI